MVVVGVNLTVTIFLNLILGVCINRNFLFARDDAIKGHVTVNGDKISKAVEYMLGKGS